VQFIVGSEPLTEAKYREIRAAGATVFPRYMATEIGTVGMGCGTPSEVGDLHLAEDAIALIQSDGGTAEARPFYLTLLLDSAPKVMLNVQLGDAGVVKRRRCGCLFGDMGFHTHLLRVRSFDHATGEGMTLGTRELTRIIEEVLLRKYGGSALDYQWVEEEDGRSLTRLRLYVHPRLGPLNEAEMVKDILGQLRRGDRGRRLVAEMWRQAGTLNVVRAEPRPTPQGKIVPVLRDGDARRSSAPTK